MRHVYILAVKELWESLAPPDAILGGGKWGSFHSSTVHLIAKSKAWRQKKKTFRLLWIKSYLCSVIMLWKVEKTFTFFIFLFLILWSKNNSKTYAVLKNEEVLCYMLHFSPFFNHFWFMVLSRDAIRKIINISCSCKQLTTKKLEVLCYSFFPSLCLKIQYSQRHFVLKLFLFGKRREQKNLPQSEIKIIFKKKSEFKGSPFTASWKDKCF